MHALGADVPIALMCAGSLQLNYLLLMCFARDARALQRAQVMRDPPGRPWGGGVLQGYVTGYPQRGCSRLCSHPGAQAGCVQDPRGVWESPRML